MKPSAEGKPDIRYFPDLLNGKAQASNQLPVVFHVFLHFEIGIVLYIEHWRQNKQFKFFSIDLDAVI